MAITGKNTDMELFYVTRNGVSKDKYTILATKKEIQSEIQRWNTITKIEKAIITKGEEVDFEYIKPQKYKGKPYTYKEKYGNDK